MGQWVLGLALAVPAQFCMGIDEWVCWAGNYLSDLAVQCSALVLGVVGSSTTLMVALIEFESEGCQWHSLGNISGKGLGYIANILG